MKYTTKYSIKTLINFKLKILYNIEQKVTSKREYLKSNIKKKIKFISSLDKKFSYINTFFLV